MTWRRPKWTVRLRLTAWYAGLFLVCGTVLLIVSSALVTRAVTASSGATAACQQPGIRCHVISAGQARAVALQAHAALISDLWSRSAITLAVMTALSAGSGWFLAGRALRPVRAITAGARQISVASLDDRLRLVGPDDELKELGDTFDQLLARLEASFRAQRQFIANAAHELRTPLARQQVIGQVALDDPAATAETLRAAHRRVLAAGAEQQHILDALLTLARGQAGLDKREPFDLAAVTGQVLRTRQADARHKDLTVHDLLAQARAAGSPALTERLVANLIDNALRYNTPDGRVEVSTATADGRAVLSIANTGPVVPESALDRLFQPFQRMTAARTGDGLGLGLCIVQAIAEAHDAQVTATPQPAGGLLVQVIFPDPTPGPGNPTAQIAAPGAPGRAPGQRGFPTW